MFNVEFVPAHNAPLSDICDNLIWARAVSACYFELTTRNATPTGELIRAVTKAHDYLDAHMDILANFNFADSRYGLWNKWALKVPESSRHNYQLDEALLLPREDGYEAHGDNSVLESDVRPFRVITLPPPCCPTATPSPSKPAVEAYELPPPIPKRPKPRMIHMPEPPKELTFSAPGKKLIGVILPPTGSALGSPNTHKHQREQEAVTNTPTPLSNICSEKVAGPSRSKPSPVPARSHAKSTEVPMLRADKVVITTKKPTFNPSLDSEAPESSVNGEGPSDDPGPLFYLSDNDLLSDEVLLPPPKRVHIASPGCEESLPPPPHAYHPLTGKPLPGLRYVNFLAPSEPAPPLPNAGPSSKAKGKQKQVEPLTLPPASAPSNPHDHDSPVIDHTIYARGFHPQVDLQFHEPPSREALECLKLSALPAVPTSLSKPPKQIRQGREYIYRCHLDENPYFIRPPLMSWPCFNCALTGIPDECVFEGNIGEEQCTMCKTNCHGPCSARWMADQLRHAATLLDLVTLSAISRGLTQIEGINTQLELLGKVVNQLHADCEQVISELADGLDAIASHEHGTEIIDAYTDISIFLKLFIVCPGMVGEDIDNAVVKAVIMSLTKDPATTANDHLDQLQEYTGHLEHYKNELIKDKELKESVFRARTAIEKEYQTNVSKQPIHKILKAITGWVQSERSQVTDGPPAGAPTGPRRDSKLAGAVTRSKGKGCSTHRSHATINNDSEDDYYEADKVAAHFDSDAESIKMVIDDRGAEFSKPSRSSKAKSHDVSTGEKHKEPTKAGY
ncbi:hypothetical protein IW262DRAFT_1469477 [Armillaria fumosa]|nr:hypothetical protein IW262DRAFT_1469477 [Armillaria fumosa]